MTEMIQIGFVLMAVVAWFVLVDSFHSKGYGFWAGHDFSILGGWLRERAVRRLGITECGGNDADGYWWRRSNGPDIRLSAEEFSKVLRSKNHPTALALSRAWAVRVIERGADGAGGEWCRLGDGTVVHLPKNRLVVASTSSYERLIALEEAKVVSKKNAAR